MFCAVFWNIGAKTPRDGIVRLVTALQREEDADAIALAGCPDGVVGSALRALNPTSQAEWEWVRTSARVRVLVRGSRVQVAEIGSHEYYSLLTVRRPHYPDLLLVAVHMVSRVYKEFDDVDEELGVLGAAIRETEARLGHTNTILMGDLNANPFANGVVTARGLHGVMSRAVAAEGGRQVLHSVWPYFFNPMWKFFGDGTAAPAGTCYYSPKGSHRAFHWNIFDQVLIRPALLPYYRDDSVRVIHRLAGNPLTRSDWTPDRAVGSDHFPICVRLDC